MGLCPECLVKGGFESRAESESDTSSEPRVRFVPPAVEDLARLFPQLEILEFIGKGGMGAIYKARQKQLNRVVALKILPPGIGHEPAFAERFAREARALAQLNHPGIVTLYEFGQSDGQFYFLMEFVDGMNLGQLLLKGRVSAREALAIVPQICDALQFAHDQGIVHRDIKPENILLDRRGRVKVADFGLVKLAGATEPVNGEAASGSLALTGSGKILGTLSYMAPEQKENPGEVDHRADIYALGVVLYQMLTGELPGKSIEPPSKRVQLDVRLDEVILRALEKEPARRFQNVGEIGTVFGTIAQGSPDPNPTQSNRKAMDTPTESAREFTIEEIKFNCPHCGQSLAVDATAAGTTLACPQCSQTVGVPKPEWPADETSSEATPAQSRTSWPAVLVLVVVFILLITAGAFLWQRHARPGTAVATTSPAAALPFAHSAANPVTVSTSGLVLYFNFDTPPVNGKIPDLSGHGNDGEAVNVQWVPDGHSGGAIVLSPTDSHIRVPNNESLNPPEFTLYAWIKTTHTDHHWIRIFDKGLFHHSFALSIAGDWTHWKPPEKYRGFLAFETLKSREATSRHLLADGQWHQIAATYDGQTKRLFVDGQVQETTHNRPDTLGNNLDLVIGGFTDPDPQHDDPHASFDGSLDDVMMFNRPLSPEEVLALYNSQKTASDAGNEP